MTFNLWTFFFQIANFVVLAYVLHRLLYRPLHEAIDQRRQANDRARAEAEQARQEAAALEAQVRAQLAGMEQQRQEVLAQAHQQADKERAALLAEAETTTRNRLAEFQQALARERTEALHTLKSEAVGMAVDLTQRLLREASDSTLHQQLAHRLIESLQQLSEAERADIRGHWQPSDLVVVESAESLKNGLADEVTSAVATILGRQVAPEIQVKPELLGGLRLRIGGHVWDASLVGGLDEAKSGRH